MHVRQQKVASFILDNDDNKAALLYLEKNAPLLKGFLLVFTKPVSDEIEERCKAWELCYKVIQGCSLNKKSLSTPAVPEETRLEEKSPEVIKKRNFLRNIRSGESVVCEDDILIQGNINDGAIISTSGTLSIFGIIEGDINCEGEYLILSQYKRGKVIFQGELITDQIKGNTLKLFYKEDNVIKMKELN